MYRCITHKEPQKSLMTHYRVKAFQRDETKLTLSLVIFELDDVNRAIAS